MFDLVCLVWYVWFGRFGLVGLVWDIWVGAFDLVKEDIENEDDLKI